MAVLEISLQDRYNQKNVTCSPVLPAGSTNMPRCFSSINKFAANPLAFYQDSFKVILPIALDIRGKYRVDFRTLEAWRAA